MTALRRLTEALGALEIAPLYRTAPISPTPQPPYLNTAAVGATQLPPDAVLALGKALELAAGRSGGADRGAEPRLGPRPLDVDLLLQGSTVRSAPELTLPHPRLRTRRFVLEPLAAIAPELRVPPDGRTVAELLEGLEDQHAVEEIPWSSEFEV